MYKRQNIYRCESLFLAGLHPATPRSAVEGRTLADLVRTASDLMRANLEPGAGFDRRFAPLGGPRGAWVYGRGGRPCYRCRTPVATAVLGDPPRDVWWCPSCQPAPA